MERAEKPYQREEEREDVDIQQIFEEEEEEEESNGGLEVRERRRKRENGGGVVIRETNEGSFEKAKEKVDEIEEIERSVYFDSEKGSNLQNGAKKDLTNGVEFPKIIISEGANKTGIHPAQNCSNSNSRPFSQQFTEIKEPASKNTINAKNYDLEKVLEEQETHDLYCPNCNSCITRRVILKKRKRIIRDINSEFRADKIPNLGINNDSLNEPLLNNQDDEEREQHILFKCLSCFTFFIPKDCGFNIFDICGGNKERLQNSQIKEGIIQNKVEIEEVQNVISRETKVEGKTVSSAESKGEIRSTVNTQDSNQISSNNWFFELLLPGRNKNKPINKPENLEDPSFSYWQNKPSDRNQIRSSKTETGKNNETLISTVTSESKIEAIESNGTKTQTAKSQDISYIASKQENQIQVVGSITVTKTEEKRKDMQINEEPNISIKGSNIPPPLFSFSTVQPSEMKTPKADFKQEPPINHKPGPVTPVQEETIIHVHEVPRIWPRNCTFCPGMNNWDILKPIVYGGLVETITSLSIVSSASASGASALNTMLIGVAAVIGGFILTLHDLMELKHAQDEADDFNHNELGRYWALLGRKGYFGLHTTIAIISYIFFGLLPPLIYGFTFRETEDSEYKLIAVAFSAIFCIAILAIGKEHTRPHRTYFTTVLYYVAIGVASSGLSYVAGILLKKLMENLGFFGAGFSIGEFFN